MEQKLKLNEFRQAYKVLQRGVPWLDHLLLGVLVWLETLLIDHRVSTEVDEAIKEYQMLHEEPLPDMVTPVYTETKSSTSDLLPEMRLQAPWRRE